MKKRIHFALFLKISLFTMGCCIGGSLSASDEDYHLLFTQILAEFVTDGWVDYENLREDERLDEYLQYLEATDPAELPSEADRLAFWINAYNAWTLKLICEHYPLESISVLHDGAFHAAVILKNTIWDVPYPVVNGEQITLNYIEHAVIRKTYKDNRIHFALVCAAISCPPLRNEAYEGYKLDTQLNEQGRIFLGQEEKNRFDPERKFARISAIFHWFKHDFGTTKANIIEELAPYLPSYVGDTITENPRRWRVYYTQYDWGLNDVKNRPEFSF